MSRTVYRSNISPGSLLTIDDLCRILRVKKSYVYSLTFQKLLGHKDIRTTMRYSHLAPEHLRSAVEKIDPDGHYMDTRAESAEKKHHAHLA